MRSVEEHPEECALAGLKHVSGFQGDPEALEAGGLLFAVVELLTRPSLRGGLGELQLEDVAALDLESVGADVVGDPTQLPDDPESGEARLLPRLAKGRVL